MLLQILHSSHLEPSLHPLHSYKEQGREKMNKQEH